MLKRSLVKFSVLLVMVVCYNCVETFDYEAEIGTFESALVIEATITDELKHQEILLSRTSILSSQDPYPENYAVVKIVDAQNEYLFQETIPGTYISTVAFSAKPDTDYNLEIITNEGKTYGSKSMVLTPHTDIDNLTVKRMFNDDGVEGISINVDSYDATGNSKYYRYTYEETYKIWTPRYSPYEIIFDEGSFVDYQILRRTEEKNICYNTVKSNTIILNSTIELMEDKQDQFLVRFINRDNYIMSYRYSILVNLYVQSLEAHNYYNQLKDLSESESLLSENQPGRIIGNVFSKDNSQEKVLGYFQVPSVSTKRIYFNYNDFFPDEDLPPFIIGCSTFFAPAVESSPGGGHPLYDHIAAGFQYYETYDSSFLPEVFPLEGPEVLIARECCDCTALGKTEAPNFWIE